MTKTEEFLKCHKRRREAELAKLHNEAQESRLIIYQWNYYLLQPCHRLSRESPGCFDSFPPIYAEEYATHGQNGTLRQVTQPCNKRCPSWPGPSEQRANGRQKARQGSPSGLRGASHAGHGCSSCRAVPGGPHPGAGRGSFFLLGPDSWPAGGTHL